MDWSNAENVEIHIEGNINLPNNITFVQQQMAGTKNPPTVRGYSIALRPVD
jgi:hypothetical protein